jgi:hypothetical protein
MSIEGTTVFRCAPDFYSCSMNNGHWTEIHALPIPSHDPFFPVLVAHYKTDSSFSHRAAVALLSASPYLIMLVGAHALTKPSSLRSLQTPSSEYGSGR